MFSSLHKVDIAVEDARGQIAIQTDHRDAGEIESTYDLSAIFALTRAINPIRCGNFVGVRFAMLNTAPERLVTLMRAAGAEVERVEQETLAPQPDDALVDQLAAEALSALGRRVLSELGVEPTAEGLIAAEREYAARARASCGPDDDEIGYWTALVELGAATGEILRSLHGGTWVRDPEFFSMIPFMISRDDMLTNVFGKVERFFERGPSEAPTRLLLAAQDQHAPDGPVMFNLRPRDWGGRDIALWEPLLASSSDEADTAPLVALVHDLPNTTKSLSHETDPEEVPALKEQALANLRGVEVEIAEISEGDLRVLIVHGSYYAAEKILDPEFMGTLHQRLGAEVLTAAVPIKGQLHVMSALVDPRVTGVFAAIVHKHHDEAPPNERLSTELLLVTEGAVAGRIVLSSGDEAPAEAPQPPAAQAEEEPAAGGFFRRLFGRS